MVETLVRHADPSLVKSEVAFLAPRGPISERLAGAGIATHSLPGVRGIGNLARLVRGGRWDVVNAYGFKASLIARLVVRLAQPRPRFICGVRGLHITEVLDLEGPKARFAAIIERALSPLVDKYDANSPGAIDFLASLGVDAERLCYIPNGLDLEHWPANRNEGAEVPSIVCVARFVPRKRHDVLVEAMSQLRDEGVPFRAVLAGEGPRYDSIKALVERRHLGEAVSLPGFVGPQQVQALMGSARVFCLPSAWEGMARGIMEAMAAGLPVVASHVNGADALVVDGVTGRLVEPNDPGALAVALREMLLDSAQANEFGAAGRRRVENVFSLDAMVAAKEHLYLSIAGRL